MLAGAVAFGMVLAGALDLGPAGMAAPVAATASSAAAPAAALVPLPSFADLAERALPAVVSIDAQTIERGHPPVRRGQPGQPGQQDPFEFFFGPRQRGGDDDAQREFRSDAGGSGFVVSTDGYVVTNNHVVEGATKIRVRLEGRDYDAELKGTDPATDLALLKIDAGRPLVALPLGDSEALRVGEQVMAIGNPLALGSTVTVGVVSAKGRSIGLTRDTSFENFIQTDAAINRGNSGGPLVNLRGEVIGIASAMNWGAENIGFAVPVDTLKAVLPQLRDSGRVSRGYLGINIQNMTWERAQAFGLDTAEGALVTTVVDDAPASQAGVRHGDVVLNVDGRKVKETRDLIDYVSSKPPGSEVTLDVLRDGKRLKLEVELSERETLADAAANAQDDEASGIEWLGLDYQDLSPGLRQNLGVPEEVDGVVVREVTGSSPLYDEGLTSGDLVTEVNGRAVTDVATFEREVGGAPSGSFLRLYVRRFDPRGRGVGAGFFAIVRVP
jgi:serine protease Do